MSSDRLYQLLPAAYRAKDSELGEPLRALAAILTAELEAIEADTETIWDNWFIETCEEWLVPYIGEALGVRGLRDVAGEFSTRAYVADALERRRRKGTIAATEDAARAVTGYPARAVEMFEHTARTVNLNHLRSADSMTTTQGTVDVRDPAKMSTIGGPFDPYARTPDVRPMIGNDVRPNLPNVEIFLWRIRSEEISGSTPRQDTTDPQWFRFDPQGRDIAVFNLPKGEESIVSLAGPEHVPRPIGRLELAAFEPSDDWPIAVGLSSPGAEPVPMNLEVCNLSDVGGALPTRGPDAAGTVLVDPELGRIVFHPDDVPTGDTEVIVDYAYGWPGQVGAGPFNRNDLFATQRREQPITAQWGVSRSRTAVGTEDIFETLDEAVVAWNAFIGGLDATDRPGTVGVITVLDSRSYDAPATQIELPDGSTLAIVAAGWPDDDVGGVPTRPVGLIDANGIRPHILGALQARGTASTDAPTRGGLLLNGLLIEGMVRINSGDLERLDVAACTIEGPSPSIQINSTQASSNGGLEVTVSRSVTGRLQTTLPIDSVMIVDSFIASDSETIDAPGAAITVNSSTVRGRIRGRTLDASDSILDAAGSPSNQLFEIAQTQEGCLRFCSVPPGASSPRRCRCQPDVALEGVTDTAARRRIIARVQPVYAVTATNPGFGLLRTDGPPELRSTSSDASEPGVWHHIQHAARTNNLRQALREELRFGLDAGVVLDR